MNCRVCGTSFYTGRTAFCCSCGILAHSWCWERHVLEAHKPSFTIGTVDLNGNFVPSNKEKGLQLLEKQMTQAR